MKQTLKEHRKSQHLTQEDLAKASGISIRTIQRIEKGDTQASPHTLRTLQITLNLQKDEIEVIPSNQTSSKNSALIVNSMNFSILSILFIPFGNLLFPLIIFLLNRKDFQTKVIGRKIIFLQIFLTFFYAILCVVLFLFIGRGNGAVPVPVLIAYPTIVLISVGVVIYTALNMNEDNRLFKALPSFI